jgi:8-oxo-dGTP pyrophosphatase MutT (NUDIX family)
MRPAAVLVGLVEREQLYLVLTRRAAHLKLHAAQVAFAGGKIDATDNSAEDAALREAYEEIGVPAHAVQVLGRLSGYSTGTGFHIVPVVGFISSDVVYQPDPSEVEQVFEVPLAFITDPANHRYHMVVRDGIERRWWSMPYTDAQGYEHFIWGATAGMLRNLYQYLLAPVR